VLREQPLCAYCSELGITTAAAVVDHAVPVQQAAELAFVRSNLQGLCKACHDGPKQQEEQRGYRLGCGADGVPYEREGKT